MAFRHDRKLNHFAVTTFRDVADQDYISARMTYRARLYPQFMWCAQQTFEKYLKCVLFLHRTPTPKDLRHDLGTALRLVQQRLTFFKLSEPTHEMIEDIDAYGRYRYFESPWTLQGHVLPRFDLAAWELRRYCQSIDPSSFPDGRCPDLIESIQRSEREPYHRFRIAGGRLEAVIENNRHPARGALLWQNLMFGTRRRRIKSVEIFSAAHPPLMHFPEILEDVDRLTYVPREVKEACAMVWGPEKAKHLAEASEPAGQAPSVGSPTTVHGREGDEVCGTETQLRN